MGLAVEAPAREELSFRTNDDKLVGVRWLKSDAVTAVVIESAIMTLRSALEVYTVDSGLTLPGDPAGWVDTGQLADGVVLVTVPYTVWADVEMRSGEWDLVAVGEGIHRCLVRGTFVVEEGLT